MELDEVEFPVHHYPFRVIFAYSVVPKDGVEAMPNDSFAVFQFMVNADLRLDILATLTPTLGSIGLASKLPPSRLACSGSF